MSKQDTAPSNSAWSSCSQPFFSSASPLLNHPSAEVGSASMARLKHSMAPVDVASQLVRVAFLVPGLREARVDVDGVVEVLHGPVEVVLFLHDHAQAEPAVDALR
jgi:hypothetical protein